MQLKGQKILVTGGASFIGSHLVEELIRRGNDVSIVDNFSTGKREYVHKKARIYYGDLLDIREVERSLEGKDVVFHLAAIHGGRGFIDERPSDVAASFSINDNVIRTSSQIGIKKLVFTSSVCVYPLKKQLAKDHPALTELDDGLKEGEIAPDGVYGLTKIAGEIEMKAYRKQYGLPCGIARLSTVYGPRMNDTHALMALVGRAMRHEDPFLVWGDGTQGRDWLFVGDAVQMLCKIAEEEEDATSYNLVSSGTITINQALEHIFKRIGWRPKKIAYDTTKPVGPFWRSISGHRFADNLGYFPGTEFEIGLNKLVKYLEEQ